MVEPLTDRQRQVLELFVGAARDALPAPTYREISDRLDFNSSHAAWCHVKLIVAKGWLARGAKGCSRSIWLTNHARAHYGLPVVRRAA